MESIQSVMLMIKGSNSLFNLQLYNYLKTIDMHRVDIFSFLASDVEELTKMQTRLNQWLTAKTLVKYEIHTTGEYIIFNVCRKKD